MQDYERKGGIHSKVNSKEFEDNFDRIFRKRCTTCGGNGMDMPCAYPSEGQQGCLQKRIHEDKCPCTNDDKDVKEENDHSTY